MFQTLYVPSVSLPSAGLTFWRMGPRNRSEKATKEAVISGPDFNFIPKLDRYGDLGGLVACKRLVLEQLLFRMIFGQVASFALATRSRRLQLSLKICFAIQESTPSNLRLHPINLF